MADIELTFREFIEEFGRDVVLKVLMDGGHDEAWASTIIAITLGEVDSDSKLTYDRQD